MSGVGGVGGVCECLARGGVGGEGGEWMRELGLGFTNPVETGGVLDMCLCFGFRGVGGVGGEWIGVALFSIKHVQFDDLTKIRDITDNFYLKF